VLLEKHTKHACFGAGRNAYRSFACEWLAWEKLSCARKAYFVLGSERSSSDCNNHVPKYAVLKQMFIQHRSLFLLLRNSLTNLRLLQFFLTMRRWVNKTFWIMADSRLQTFRNDYALYILLIFLENPKNWPSNYWHILYLNDIRITNLWRNLIHLAPASSQTKQQVIVLAYSIH